MLKKINHSILRLFSKYEKFTCPYPSHKLYEVGVINSLVSKIYI